MRSNSKGEKLRGPRDWFEPAIKQAKIPDYTWHCNRHTFASRLVMAGVDLRTVAQLMGHRTIQMTMRYAHLAPDHQQSAVERLVKTGSIAKMRNATKTATSKFSKAVAAGVKSISHLISVRYKTCESGGIGRRTRLRIWRVKPWGFESPLSHQLKSFSASGTRWAVFR